MFDGKSHVVLNVALLYPERHSSHCQQRKCDGCNRIGWECVIDRAEMARRIALLIGDTSDTVVVQMFLCRSCRQRRNYG